MKNEIRMALLCLAGAATPAFAQNASPLCGATNYDYSQNIYTINKPVADTINQQCFVVVYPQGGMPVEAPQNPASYIVEGSYAILISGGGGGGGSGARSDQGGGGGGAGAEPMRTVQYLSPGIYKLTIGTGGDGGSVGGRAKEGNPSSLTLASNGQLIAGTQGADVWQQRYGALSGGSGGIAASGSKGGSGGDSGPSSEKAAEVGGKLQTTSYSGTPGQAGSERMRAPDGSVSVQANAGGGGGAGVGSGGAGESPLGSPAAGSGKLGAGGGGGSGGKDAAYAGGRGGHGFIKLSLNDLNKPAATINR